MITLLNTITLAVLQVFSLFWEDISGTSAPPVLTGISAIKLVLSVFCTSGGSSSNVHWQENDTFRQCNGTTNGPFQMMAHSHKLFPLRLPSHYTGKFLLACLLPSTKSLSFSLFLSATFLLNYKTNTLNYITELKQIYKSVWFSVMGEWQLHFGSSSIKLIAC